MADGTKIEWTDATVNAVNGCSVVSPGCTNCYAMRLAGTRLRDHPSRAGLTQDSKAGPVWTGEVRLNEKALLEPLRWKKPRRIFWNAHGDLFHPAVPDAWIDRVFAVCALTPQHTHQILTKRPERMREYCLADGGELRAAITVNSLRRGLDDPRPVVWPLPNVWLGTSVEDQKRADERIPHLLATPAAVRFLSCEPLLSGLELSCIDPYVGPANSAPGFGADMLDVLKGEGWIFDEDGELDRVIPIPHLDWVIVGGESGPGARPMHPDWARSLRDQCAAAGVPFFFKQWGESCPVRPDLIPVAWRNIGWVARDGRHKYGCTEADHEPMYDDDDQFGPAFWAQTVRVGKKAAGRLLDGVQHDGMPG